LACGENTHDCRVVFIRCITEPSIVFKLSRYLILSIILVATAIVHWLALMMGHDFISPLFFIEEKGLTALKINTEYIIIGSTLITILLLLRLMHHPLTYHAPSLLAGLCIIAMSDEMICWVWMPIINVPWKAGSS
jgi:hypothetical protein